MKNSQIWVCSQDKQSGVVVEGHLYSTSFWKAMLLYLNKSMVCLYLKGSWTFQDITINQDWLSSSNFLWQPQIQTRHGKMHLIMVRDGTYLKDYTFVQVVLLAVTHNSNDNKITLFYAVVLFKAEDNCMWFWHQLEQDFPGSCALF